MRRYHIIWTVLILLGILGTSPEQALSETKPSDPNAGMGEQAFAPDRIIVKLEEEAPANAIASLNRRNDARIEEKIPHSRVSVVDIPQDLSVTEAVERYESSPDVQYAEPDYLLSPDATPDDPRYSEQWALNNTGQLGGTEEFDVDAPEAWEATVGTAETVVAVIDTGVDIDHPDIKGNIWTNPDEVPGNNKDDDENGYVDDVHGWDFHHDDSSVFDPADGDSHGTHVAGIIAAEGNNKVGVTGVSWNTKIMPLKFIGPDVAYTSDVIAALRYAVAEGVQISNNSWGGGGFSQSLFDAIKMADSAGMLFVASAGNDGENTDIAPHYPSGYDSPNVISVAATDQSDSLANFGNSRASNYGAATVDLAAPGRYILGTVPSSGYAYYSGTSMAAPHVAGVAALLEAQNSNRSHADIRATLLESVDIKENLVGKVASGGRLNAARALGLDATANTAPQITDVSPAASAKIRKRTPAVSATVRDAQTELTKNNIQAVYLDGRLISAFSYNAGTDRLTFTPSGKLSYSRHTVKIIAQDPVGLTATRSWSFRVVR